MAELLVPWAIDPSGEIVGPEDASKGTDYLCPQCRTALIFRAGSTRVRHHFAHHPGGVCTQETILHAAAKTTLFDVIEKWLHRKGPTPRLILGCLGTDLWRCENTTERPLLKTKVDEVRLEWTLPDGLRPDLVLLKNNVPVLGLEVRVTNPVSAIKAARLKIPWVELDAKAILNAPNWWSLVNQRIPASKIRWRCEFCRSAEPGLSERIAQGILQSPWDSLTAREAKRTFNKAATTLVKESRNAWRQKHGSDAPWVTILTPDFGQLAELCSNELKLRKTELREASWKRTLQDAEPSITNDPLAEG